MKNILVGIDFDEQTEMLIEKSQKLAKHYGAKLWLLHAVPIPPEYVGFEASAIYIPDEKEAVLSSIKQNMNKYSNQLSELGIENESIVMEGATTDVILKESKVLNVDLIICGHHEHNFLYNILFGSVSTAIVRKSSIPVLVFPLG